MLRPLILTSVLLLGLLLVPTPGAPDGVVQATHVPICGPSIDGPICVIDCIYDAIFGGHFKRIGECFS